MKKLNLIRAVAYTRPEYSQQCVNLGRISGIDSLEFDQLTVNLIALLK